MLKPALRHTLRGALRPALQDLKLGLPQVDGTITIVSPVQHQAMQRTVGLTVSGTYTVTDGDLVAIQVRFNGGSWRTLDPSPAAGSFSGTASVSPGVGTVEVRLNTSEVTDSVADVLVGEVFAIMGQSNAQGQGENLQDYEGSTAKMYRDGAWSALADPVGENGTDGSAYPMLADLLETALNVPVAYVVGDTAGGTGLLAPSADWSEGGDNYEATVGMVNDSGVNGVRAILWYQGERDAITAKTQSAYQDGLSAMLDAFQADCAALASAKLIAAVIGPSTTATEASLNAIRAAIINRWENDSDILSGPTAHANFDPADELHWFTDAEMERLSRMWARTILGNFFTGQSPRGPRVVSTAVGTADGLLATQLSITFDNLVGSFANGTDVDGWRVTDYNGTRTVVSATASGSTITLTCDDDLTDEVKVWFASGEDAMDSSLVDGGTLVGLSPEPIIERVAGTGVVIPSLKQNLLGWYALEEASGNRSDSHTTARTLTDNNTVGSATGKIGDAASFVAANTEYLSRSSDITTALGSGFSVAFWFKTSGAATQALFAKLGTVSSNGQFGVYIGSTGAVVARVNSSSNNYIGRSTATGNNDGEWHLCVVTYDGSGTSAGVKIYLDNAQADTGNSQAGTFASISSVAANLSLGAFSAGGSPLTGDLDEAAWWNKVLSSDDRAALWNAGAGITYTDI
jgi:hypothetical protein